MVKWKKNKILNKFKFREKRRNRLIKEGDCSVKHLFTPSDLAKAAICRDLNRKFQCLRCKKWISAGAMLAFVLKKEGIDLKDKQGLVDRYLQDWDTDKPKDNESKKDDK